jgi:hypothetical protein
MTRTVSISQFRPEFSDFLIAPVGNDSNGMLVSVLSAIARQNVDPWQEAAELARLPRETAIQRLAALIATLPDGAPPHQNPSATAATLIALLPRRQPFETRSQTPSIKAVAMTKHSSLVVVMILFLAVMLCAKYIAASSQPPEHGIGARAPTTSTSSPITASRNLSP